MSRILPVGTTVSFTSDFEPEPIVCQVVKVVGPDRPGEQVLYQLGTITPRTGLLRSWPRVERFKDLLAGESALEVLALPSKSSAGGAGHDGPMERSTTPDRRARTVSRVLVTLLGLMFLALGIAAGISGDLMRSLGFFLVTMLAGANAYLLGDHPARPRVVQRYVTLGALAVVLPLALIAQILAIIS